VLNKICFSRENDAFLKLHNLALPRGFAKIVGIMNIQRITNAVGFYGQRNGW